MERDDAQERNLPASQRRLDKAREEGQVARSRELPAFLLVALGAAALWAGAESVLAGFGALVRSGLQFGAADAFDAARPLARLAGAAAHGLALAAPLFVAATLLALAAPLAVGGWIFSGRALAFDWNRLDPFRGFARMFSMHGAAELAKAIAKAALIGAVAAALLGSQLGALAALLSQPFPATLAGALGILGLVALGCALAFGLVAAADVPFALWWHRRELRMSPEEARRELKETEGDPQLKARVRSLQREQARRRMMQEVPKAAVVVTNPEHYAVALAWREGAMRAPRVVAKGRGLVALRIRALAVQAAVPVAEAPPLARALWRHVEIGAEVPRSLYVAVAQVLAWAYQLRAARAAGAGEPPPPELQVPSGMDRVA
jgi:flagellar biosynthetic protein FlhB